MTGFLLDTNVLSEVLKKRPSTHVVERLRALAADQIFTASICIMELRFGAMRGSRDRTLWDRIETEVLPRVRVVPFDDAAAIKAGDILAALEREGAPIGTEDVMIGATAVARGLAVATRNTRHLGRIAGLEVVDWWA